MNSGDFTVAELQKLLLSPDADKTAILTAMRGDARRSVRNLATSFFKRMQRQAEELKRLEEMYRLEKTYYDRGIFHVAGVDEAGRGPIAGPVMIAAVILPPLWVCPGLNDSKKVSPKKRDRLYDEIMTHAVAVSCIAKTEKEIDELDIYHATQAGMYEAVNTLSTAAEAVLCDAMPLPQLSVPHRSIIGGDALSASIAAASIIAKVTRDRLMQEYDRAYPAYGFAVHKGYLTQRHRAAVLAFGPCPIHRRSFEPIKSMIK